MKANTKNKPVVNAVEHAMLCEIQRQIAEFDKQHAQEFDAMVLWVLNKEFGFGEKRLRRYYDRFSPVLHELITRYELGKADTPWICKEDLKKIRVDLDEWEKERKR